MIAHAAIRRPRVVRECVVRVRVATSAAATRISLSQSSFESRARLDVSTAIATFRALVSLVVESAFVV